ncbi:type IV secretion system DNA-binding domain-containing protein [Geopseudomonas aromaticivorans]
MAQQRQHNRYSEAAKELDTARYYRENLTPWDRMCYGIQSYSPPAIMLSGITSLAVPGVTEAALGVAVALGGAYAATQRPHQWPLCVPSSVSTATPMHKFLHKLVKHVPVLNTKVKDPKDMPGDGILYLGSDMDNNAAQIWTSLDLMVRHMLLIGTTGSGKTQVILGMLAQLMAQGSGGIFVDGKADVTTWFFLYTLARHFGLERQLLVINYLTSGGIGTKRSNTTNVFEVATPDALCEMISSMMGEGGANDGMWRGRAEALFSIVIRAAAEDRDLRGKTIVPDDLREMMSLGNVLELPKNPRFSERVRREAALFLSDLPGYSAFEKATTPQAKEQCMGRMSEQLGFLQMQFSRILGLLSGTYGYITGTDISEIDWIDVINQRRTLYVMLPALEKSPESLKQLGRMVVTSLRNAVLPVVGGGKLTGSKRILVDGRPIGKSIPYGIFLDEYGSYCVEGFGDVVAQIRSMSIFACFAGQDWASFKKGSDVESGRVNSNTGTKIFLKSFDAETVKLLAETAGKKLVTVATNFSNKPSGANASVDTKFNTVESLSAQEVDRVKIETLAQQGPGMAHIYYGGKVWSKVKMFYPDIKQSAFSQVNSFLRMRTQTGVTGRIEEVEDKISAEHMVNQWREAFKDQQPAKLPQPKQAVINAFDVWVGDVHKRLAGRNPELLDVLKSSMEAVGAKPDEPPAKPAVPGRSSIPRARTERPPAASVADAQVGGATAIGVPPELPPMPADEAPAAKPAVSGSIAGLTRKSRKVISQASPVTPDAAAESAWFSMDEPGDQAVVEGAARSAISSDLMERTLKIEKMGESAIWGNTPQEVRMTANTMVAEALPVEGGDYPAKPHPQVVQPAALVSSINSLLSRLTNTLVKSDAADAGEKESSDGVA